MNRCRCSFISTMQRYGKISVFANFPAKNRTFRPLFFTLFLQKISLRLAGGALTSQPLRAVGSSCSAKVGDGYRELDIWTFGRLDVWTFGRFGVFHLHDFIVKNIYNIYIIYILSKYYYNNYYFLFISFYLQCFTKLANH